MVHDPFLALLHSFKSHTLSLSAAPGNSGDRLLQKGLELYLQIGNFTLSDDPETADVVIMHGGGSIDDVWQTGLEHLEHVLKTYPDKVIVVAPSTCHFSTTDFKAFLEQYDQDIYLFAREHDTYSRLEKLNVPSNVFIELAHDTALLLQETEYLSELQASCTESYPLYALRTDKESSFVPFGLDRKPHTLCEKLIFCITNYKLHNVVSAHMEQTGTDVTPVIEDISYLPYDTFLDRVQHASVVHTDRLHVGILATLLHKKTYLYDTRYKKISGVYQQSLSRYTNVVPMFLSNM